MDLCQLCMQLISQAIGMMFKANVSNYIQEERVLLNNLVPFFDKQKQQNTINQWSSFGYNIIILIIKYLKSYSNLTQQTQMELNYLSILLKEYYQFDLPLEFLKDYQFQLNSKNKQDEQLIKYFKDNLNEIIIKMKNNKDMNISLNEFISMDYYLVQINQSILIKEKQYIINLLNQAKNQC
ncbi:hypothetical protein K502DRAFT_322615, partial [Neoconidiobolus thromboides FSU 785]